MTLFHEFGHILHQTLTRAETVRFSGTSTERDFVEAPSQIMEHWCWRPEVLGRFARHHETGEPIPPDLVDQLVAARDLNVGVITLRQVQFGVLDMGFHGPRRPEDGTRARRRPRPRRDPAPGGVRRLFDHVDGTFMPASFGHLLSGYDAGYYGYLWSKVYGDDMFSKFAAEGVTDPAVGGAYRAAILERGGSRPATEMLEDFLGRQPSNEAFLAELGIRVTATDAAVARRAIALLDLTDLGADTTADAAADASATGPPRPPSPRCACGRSSSSSAPRRLAGTGVRVATVVNFPAGTDPAERVAAVTAAAVAAGADEIDVVLPYRAWLAGDTGRAADLLAAVRDGPASV